jgi:CRP-like cAMP-binding protein
MRMMKRQFQNSLLRNLPDEVIQRLRLVAVNLPTRLDIERPGEAIEHLLFIEEGIGSMTTAFRDGMQVETSMFGFESVIGVSALMGVRQSLNRIFMQLAGRGYRCRTSDAEAEFQRGGIFQKLVLRYVQVQLTLSTQNAACNATHTNEERLARWLLICSDRAHCDSMDMAQDFLSEMLGSTRSTVSIAAGHLKGKGLIDYRRGAISLLDKKGLEAEACECYRVVRNHVESLDAFDTGFLS